MGTRTIQWAPTKRKPSTQNQKCYDLIVFGRDVFQDLGNAQLLCLTNTRCKTWQTQGLNVANKRCKTWQTQDVYPTWQTQGGQATWQTLYIQLDKHKMYVQLDKHNQFIASSKPNPDLFLAWAWTLVGNQGKKEPCYPWSRAAVFACGWKGYQVVTNTNEVQSRLTSEANIQTRIGQHHTQQATTSLSQWVLLHGFGPPVILQCPPWRFGRNGSLIDDDWRSDSPKMGPQLTTFHLHPGDRHKTNRTPEETAEEKAPIQQIEHVFISVLFVPSWNPKPASAQQKSKTWHRANSLHWPAFTNLKAMEQVMSSMRQGYRQQQHPPPPSSTALST